MKFDLSGFKKIKQDAKTTTLKHPKGHTITIAHKAVSEGVKKQLQALPMDDNAQPQPQDKFPQENQEVQQEQAMSKGGKVKKLDDGGEVDPEPTASPSPDTPPDVNKKDAADFDKGFNNPTPSFGQAIKNIKTGLGFAKGGKVKKMSDGGSTGDPQIDKLINQPDSSSVDDNSQAPATPPQDQPTSAPIDPVMARKREIYNGIVTDSLGNSMDPDLPDLAGPMRFGENGEAPKDFDADAWRQASTQYQKEQADQQLQMQQIDQTNQARAEAGLPPLPGGTPKAPAPSPDRMPSGGPDQQPQQQQDPFAVGGPNSIYGQELSAMNSAPGAFDKYAQAEQTYGNTVNDAATKNAEAQQKALSDFQNHVTNNENEYQAVYNDYKNSLDPKNPNAINFNRYTGNMGTLSKIGTIIAMGIGGAGAGAAHQQNLAFNALQNNIDRDVEQQKTELGAKQNMLTANLNHYRNLQDAMDATKLQLNAIAQAKIDAASGLVQGPAAAARVAQMKMDLAKQKAQLQMSIAARQAMMNMASGPGAQDENHVGQYLNTMSIYAPEYAKDLRGRYLPGAGFADRPVPDESLQKYVAMKDFHKQMNNLYAWAAKHSGETRITDPTDFNMGRAMAQAAQNSYRTAQQMGVYKQSEAPLLEGEIPQDPTAFLNKYRVLPQYKAVMQNNDRKLNTFLNAYGLRTHGPVQQGAPIVK